MPPSIARWVRAKQGDLGEVERVDAEAAQGRGSELARIGRAALVVNLPRAAIAPHTKHKSKLSKSVATWLRVLCWLWVRGGAGEEATVRGCGWCRGRGT